jgi:hypothetical protein
VYFDAMDSKETHGLCRINPPVVIPRVETAAPSGALLTKAHTSFPYVRSTDWCGEHTAIDTVAEG